MKDEVRLMKNLLKNLIVVMHSRLSPPRWRPVSSRTSSFILHPSSFLSHSLPFVCLCFILHPSSFLFAAVPGLAVAERPNIEPPSIESLSEQARAWLEERQVGEEVAAEAERLWQIDDPALAALDRLARVFALADERAAGLVAVCEKPRPKGPLAPQEWLKAEELKPFERDNLRLYYGAWLARQRLYDDALAQLGELTAGQVIDPATLLFYQGVVYHRLLDKEPGLRAIKQLLTGVAGVPRRYQSVAELMQHDLEALKDESLDHVSRQMEDVRRRLALGRAGTKVRQVEDDVIKALDKMIDEMEKRQQQQQQQSADSQPMPAPPQKAMSDSRLSRMKSPGEVDRRRIGDSSGWGDLPPKQREEALQQIGKEFPSHYRDAIEQYFRKLAAETEE
jgi:hypothetical protein